MISLNTARRLRAIAYLGWAAVAMAFAAFLGTIARVPIPWTDEIWMASASESLVHGGKGVPLALPPGPWYAPFPFVYGPVFFYLSAVFIRFFDMSPTTARIACVVGAALLVLFTAALIRATGADVGLTGLAAATMTLSPELGTIATNGRMDTLTIAFEVGGMAAAVAAFAAGNRRTRWLLGAAAGACWLLAVLTSVRALPLVGAVAAASVWLMICRSTRAAAPAIACAAGAVFIAGILLWLHHMGVTPAGWARSYLESSRSDAQNLRLPGQARVWGLELRNAITPAVIAAATALLSLLWLAVRTGRGADGDDRRPDRGGAATVVALFVACAVNVAFIFTVANHVFTSSSYFVLPLFAAVIGATAVVGRRAGYPQIVLLFWIAVATLFSAGRIVKYIEVVQTWRDRDPAPLQQFVERWVPPGSLVFGYDQYYYFAVQKAGSTYRTWTPTPFPPVAFGRPTGISVEGEPSPALADKRFLLWPDRGLPGAVPAWFACAIPHVVARFSVSDGQPTGVEHLVGFIPALHGYPDSLLYQLPADCHP